MVSVKESTLHCQLKPKRAHGGRNSGKHVNMETQAVPCRSIQLYTGTGGGHRTPLAYCEREEGGVRDRVCIGTSPDTVPAETPALFLHSSRPLLSVASGLLFQHHKSNQQGVIGGRTVGWHWAGFMSAGASPWGPSGTSCFPASQMHTRPASLMQPCLAGAHHWLGQGSNPSNFFLLIPVTWRIYSLLLLGPHLHNGP